MKQKNNMRQLALLCFFVVLGTQAGDWVYQNRTGSATPESREKRLQKVEKGWSILVEQPLEGGMVSAMVNKDGRQGLAIFEEEEGKYRLQGTVMAQAGETVLAQTVLDGETYHLFWKNREDLDRAEVTFTSEDGQTVCHTLEAEENRILCCAGPEWDAYTLNLVVYNSQGQPVD